MTDGSISSVVITLEGLFSDIDLAKSGINQNVAPKGKVTEIFS
jgi:hypothetical protein